MWGEEHRCPGLEAYSFVVGLFFVNQHVDVLELDTVEGSGAGLCIKFDSTRHALKLSFLDLIEVLLASEEIPFCLAGSDAHGHHCIIVRECVRGQNCPGSGPVVSIEDVWFCVAIDIKGLKLSIGFEFCHLRSEHRRGFDIQINGDRSV